MALQDTDLFVVQSQDDKQLYSVRLDVLKADIAAGAGVNFKGSADLNVAPADQGITSPDNGDLYMVESNANPIAVEWVIQESPTSATKGDRIIYDGDNSDWILITSGSSNAGTITNITATLPLKSDNHPTSPVLSIRQARTAQGAIDDGDGEGTAGAIAKLAVEADVVAGGSADATAVVTADLLEATNVEISNINTTIGNLVTGVSKVSTTDANTNGALTISPETGNVEIEIATSGESQYGVVQIATAAQIASGDDGADAMVDASHLKAVSDVVNALVTGVSKVSTTDANTNGALTISPETGNVEIEIATSSETQYGVVQIATDAQILAGDDGADAMVDASHLKVVSDAVAALVTGVSSVSTDDAAGNSALTITPTTGAVKAEIATSSETAYGVVQIATAAEILSGEDGAEAVVDASHLKAVNDRLPVGTAEGQYLKWDSTNSVWTPTDTIDGGEYAT